jgi:hypothetical protein
MKRLRSSLRNRAGSGKQDRRSREDSALLDGSLPRPARRAAPETPSTESRSPLQGQGGPCGPARGSDPGGARAAV